MQKLTMKFGGELIEVVVKRNQLFFYDTASQMTTTIEGLKLDKQGVIKEFPDLKEDKQWKEKAIYRLKEHIKKLKTEFEKVNYIKEELKQHGYTPLFIQRAGFRPQKTQ